jgi:hypothetical protein
MNAFGPANYFRTCVKILAGQRCGGVGGEASSGQAEAAAHALFASLMCFRVDGERIIGI